MPLRLLVDPRVHGATFEQTLEVAKAELRACFLPTSVSVVRSSTLTFLEVEGLDAEQAPGLARLSFVQGVLHAEPDERMQVLDADPDFALPQALVWGAKYRGKTHELITQLALNVAWHACQADPPWRLLDPMAGRGTTLFWGARYGLSSWGIEQDPKALEHVRRDVSRITKVHRIRHQMRNGSAGRKRSDGVGRTLDIRFEPAQVQLVTGDSRNAPGLVGPGRYALLVTDVPYGVEHRVRGGRRNPLDDLRACIPAWTACLVPGGVAAIVFNRLLPARESLAAALGDAGLTVLPFEAPHRVSESILRDVIVARRERRVTPTGFEPVLPG